MDLTKLSNDIVRTVDKNSPTILTALGVGGLVTTVILAVKATIKAEEILYQEAEFRMNDWSNHTGEDKHSYPIDPMFSTKEIIKLTWQTYIPTAAMGLVTIGCIIGSNHINLRRNAALASMFTIVETAAREYQEKVREQLGEAKEEKIRSEIAEDHLKANPVNEKTVILTGLGNYLCFDDFSKRYFRSNSDLILRAQNEFNQRLLQKGWLGINEFYEELGLEPIELGDEFGWIAERQLLHIRKDVKMAPDTNEPCLVMSYEVSPHHI